MLLGRTNQLKLIKQNVIGFMVLQQQTDFCNTCSFCCNVVKGVCITSESRFLCQVYRRLKSLKCSMAYFFVLAQCVNHLSWCEWQAVADLHSKILDAPPPPRGPNSFNFMQFLGKFGKIVCWCPPESWRPLLGEILDPPLARHKVGSQ